jgi:hypothetical protein
MKRIRLGLILVVPALFLIGITIGCGSKDTGRPAGPTSGGGAGADEKKQPTPAGAKEELASTGWGTLTGKVIYDGDPPKVGKVNIPDANKDKAYCEGGDTTEPEDLKVGADKGVESVVVWLRAPAGKFFKIPDSQKERKDEVTVDQPKCAFIPHTVVLYPSYYDAKSKRQKETGQKFKVHNGATISHNTNFSFSDPIVNPGGENPIIAAGKHLDVTVKASKDKDAGGEQHITLKCNIHPWMKGHGWIFDHPFAAVTKKDGSFEIKDAPAGAEVELFYWHEALGTKPQSAGKITLKDGPNPAKEIKVKK